MNLEMQWNVPFKLKWPNFIARLRLAYGMVFNKEHYIMLPLSKNQEKQVKDAFEGKDVVMAFGISEVI